LTRRYLILGFAGSSTLYQIHFIKLPTYVDLYQTRTKRPQSNVHGIVALVLDEYGFILTPNIPDASSRNFSEASNSYRNLPIRTEQN